MSKTQVYITQKPPAEIRPLNEISQSLAPREFSAIPKPEAPDLAGYLVSNASVGTPVSASGVSPQHVAITTGFTFGNSIYIIPRDGAILQVEINTQIEAFNLEEETEISHS